MPAGPDQLYEKTIVLRSQLGDEAAFAELLDRHGRAIHQFTQRMMQSSPNDVADLVQEIWLAIYRGLPALRDAGKFRAWAMRVARDRIYREYRRRKLPLLAIDETELGPASQESEDKTTLSSDELQHCLEAIAPEHREALLLRFLEEMSYEDIARVTGVTVGTVRSRIHYAKRALRMAWEAKKT